MKSGNARRKRQRQMCGSKVRYKDHDDAVTMATKARAARGTPLRAYECSACGGGWHLTRDDVLERRVRGAENVDEEES